MSSLLVIWRRVPVLLRAVLVGLVAAAAGSLPWALLVSANARHAPAEPWGPLVMAGYLWLYWRYLAGRGWPASTAVTRRTNVRARPLSGPVWGKALFAGFLGLWATVAFMRLLGRLVVLPQETAGDMSASRWSRCCPSY